MSPSRPLNENPGCLSGLFGRKKLQKEAIEEYPYQISGKFMSPAELSFYLQAREILSGKYIICPKVSLAELLEVTVTDKSQFQSAFNRISAKRIDFLVCDAETMKPVYAIELDDASHERKARVDRDEFVNKVFRKVGLPLLRADCKQGYSHQEMVELLLAPFQQNFASRADQQPGNNGNSFGNEVPVSQVFCSNCGAPMRKKAASAGAHVGEYYWVCSQYPKCPTFYPAGEHVK